MGFWAGAGSGAMTGATVGASFPPYGIIVGAVIGGLIGGISGWLGGKSDKERAEEERRARIAQATEAWDASERKRTNRAKVGVNMLSSLASTGSGNYNGRVNLSGMALDADSIANLTTMQKRDFSAGVPDTTIGMDNADAAAGLNSVLSGAGGLAGYLGSGSGGAAGPDKSGIGITTGGTAGSLLGGLQAGQSSGNPYYGAGFDPNDVGNAYTGGY